MSEFKTELKLVLFENRDFCKASFNSEIVSTKEDLEWLDEESVNGLAKLNTLGIEVQYVDNHGGEGQGEDYWSIYKFTKEGETLYVKFQGHYYSYEGSTYDDFYFVTPKEVLVTQYVAE
jgi:hypothetical protein